MLLYAQSRNLYDFLALELIRGSLNFTYNLGSGRVVLSTTSATYNDGQEHTVGVVWVEFVTVVLKGYRIMGSLPTKVWAGFSGSLTFDLAGSGSLVMLLDVSCQSGGNLL